MSWTVDIKRLAITFEGMVLTVSPPHSPSVIWSSVQAFFCSSTDSRRDNYFSYCWPSSNIVVVNISLSFSSLAPGTSFTESFSDVQSPGRKFEQASFVGNIMLAHLKAFATSSEQKKARPSSTSLAYFRFSDYVRLFASLWDGIRLWLTWIGLWISLFLMWTVWRFFNCFSLNL